MIGALLAAVAAAAPTVAVRAEVTGDFPAEAVESAAWHALYGVGHEARVVGDDAVAAMSDAGLATLLDVRVRWERRGVDTGERVAAAWAPVTEVVRRRLVGGRLVEDMRWTVAGDPVLYRTGGQIVSLPQIAVENNVAEALAAVEPPAWRAEDARIVAPVVIVADEEYRARHGAAWPEVAARRVRRASALLAPAGITLEVVGADDWTSPDDAGLGALLADVARDPLAEPRALRIAFTGQPDAAWDAAGVDLGRAYCPGRDVLVVDRAAVPHQAQAWDEAREAAAAAHEVLHAFGVPHDTDGGLMAAEEAWAGHAMDARSRALARVAAQARWSHWDPVAAAEALALAAGEHLDDPADQIAYIVGNLADGIGAPDPDDASLSALTARALATYELTGDTVWGRE